MYMELPVAVGVILVILFTHRDFYNREKHTYLVLLIIIIMVDGT